MTERLSELFESISNGNTPRDMLIALAITLIVPSLAWLFERVLIARLRKLASQTSTALDDTLIDCLENTKFTLMVVVGAWAGGQSLEVAPRLAAFLEKAAVVAVLLQIGIWVSTAIRATLARQVAAKRASDDPAGIGTISVVALLARVAVWSVVSMLLLDNFGVDISALLAGLGIGGIAVALAVQNILGDLFASVSILLDKPFQVGDFIIIGEHMGAVEKVGLKTTRLRSLSGEQLIFANGDLLNSRIRNYQRMEERRVVFHVGVTYETPAEKVEAVPAMLKEAVESETPHTRFDRAHFQKLGDSALMFEVVYYMTSADYTLYMDVQQRINLHILRALERGGIDIAYPTQTLHLRGSAAAA